MKPFQHKSDIFFDLDHTLWDFEKNSALAFEMIFKKHHLEVNLDFFLEHYIPTNLKFWKLYREEKISQEELRYQRLKEVFDLMNYKVTADLIHLISQEYIQYLPKFNHLHEGAYEILDYLYPNYNLHIITNGFESVQNGKLKNSDLLKYFKTITHSESAGVKKPNPIIFNHAIQSANTNKENSIMIGDSWEVDIEGALNYGMDAIFFNELNIPIHNNFPQVNQLLHLKNYL
ncbi:MAG: YjjG family noncanonical pyrimidine nucleotidase [Flavobacterium sp.]|uniref:YjjG family noncanonical pyrimidine nucleotidase n=1 Tax=Flavobacterium sp. TaxID=239 RepID=UPI001D1BE942|nr:YjjG family noncanonical pyrimidine nucleotidase [Flavobacterium sp.]